MMNKQDIEERPSGISAVMILNGSKEWLGPSIESIVPLFDEILIIQMTKDEEEQRILDRFVTYKIKKITEPVNITNRPQNEVYEECKKWAVLNSKYSHICEWGADMLLLQDFVSDEIYKKILECRFLKFKGYNVTTKKLNRVSKEEPHTKMKVRAYKFTSDTILKKQDSIVNTMMKAKKIEEPIYLYTKNIAKEKQEGEMLPLKLPNFFFKGKEDYLK